MSGDLIIIDDYCSCCKIDPDFILMLGQDGLIDICVVDNQSCFPASQLDELERYARLYYDLSINVPGIDAIRHLLSQIDDLQMQVRQLEDELRLYR